MSKRRATRETSMRGAYRAEGNLGEGPVIGREGGDEA